MDKVIVRNTLFKRYFQIENGVLVTDLLDKLSFIPETWKQLHLLCEKNIKGFDAYSHLEGCKRVEQNQTPYLILKFELNKYIIINLNKMKSITKAEAINEFDESFFVDNFGVIKENPQSNYSDFYRVKEYQGNIQQLINFYVDNQDIFDLSNQLYYRLDIENAWTYFYINFINGDVQIGFESQNRLLYEHLYFQYNLKPLGMQDAQQKMGIDNMLEIFEKVQNIHLPIDCIPFDLYQEYLSQCNINTNKLMIKKL